MNILISFWIFISHLGIKKDMNLGEQKSITILNRFLLGILTLFTFLIIFNLIIYDTHIVAYAISGNLFMAITGLVLNFYKKTNLSKILISIFFSHYDCFGLCHC